MARPYKENLDYFPLETTNNFETKTILLRFQSFGFAALIIIKQLIFNHSYYIKYDQNFIDMIAMELHLTEKKDLENLKRLLEHLLEREYFDKEMFKKHGILTNAEIQKVYITASRQRNNFSMNADYFLLSKDDMESFNFRSKKLKKVKNRVVFDTDNSVNSVNNSVNSVNNSVNSTKSTQIKRNKIKQNEIKGNKSKLNKGIDKVLYCNETKSARADYDFSLHIIAESLINRNLIPTDLTTVKLVNDLLFHLNNVYSGKEVLHAGYKLIATMSAKDFSNKVNDYLAYIETSLINSIEAKRDKAASNEEGRDLWHPEVSPAEDIEEVDSDLASKRKEIEKLKEIRRNRKEVVSNA